MACHWTHTMVRTEPAVSPSTAQRPKLLQPVLSTSCLRDGWAAAEHLAEFWGCFCIFFGHMWQCFKATPCSMLKSCTRRGWMLLRCISEIFIAGPQHGGPSPWSLTWKHWASSGPSDYLKVTQEPLLCDHSKPPKTRAREEVQKTGVYMWYIRLQGFILTTACLPSEHYQELSSPKHKY